MKPTERASYEGIGAESSNPASPFEGMSLPNEACVACGHTFIEADPVLLYVYRPAGRTRYTIGCAVCGDEKHEKRTEFTLGSEELLIEGRVGTCADAATQSTWLVLIAPETVGVSDPSSKALTTPRSRSTENTNELNHAGLATFHSSSEAKR